MITEVAKDIYTFEVILPRNPLKALNVYVIKGDDRTVLFDTGFNAPESEEALRAGLKELDLELEDVEVVLTHLHSDHVGLVNLFDDVGCKVYAGEVDGELMNIMSGMEYWEDMRSLFPLYGMNEDEIITGENPAFKHRLPKPVDFIPLKIGEEFVVGDYRFEILDLAGHTPGHIGLYDADKKLIFSADTILDPITPNITFWGFEYENILNTYVETLKRLKKLDLERAMATHRKIVENPSERMTEIIEHHNERLTEILDAMTGDEAWTVRNISANISWRIPMKGWDNFPASQKWFATGETMAHLHHLVHTNCVDMKNEEGTLYFKKLKDEIVPFTV